MNKILLVIQREYLTRIQKKSFWVASLLGPILITAIYAVPIWLAMQDKEVKRIEVVDESGLFQTADLVDKEVEFKLVNKPVAELKANFAKEGFSPIKIHSSFRRHKCYRRIQPVECVL